MLSDTMLVSILVWENAAFWEVSCNFGWNQKCKFRAIKQRNRPCSRGINFSCFPVTHKVGNVDIFVLPKFEKYDR